MPKPEAGMPLQFSPPLAPVPWAMFEAHRAQALANHHQSIEELRRRGGLSPCEALAILEDRPWRRMPAARAIERLAALVAHHRAELP